MISNAIGSSFSVFDGNGRKFTCVGCVEGCVSFCFFVSFLEVTS